MRNTSAHLPLCHHQVVASTLALTGKLLSISCRGFFGCKHPRHLHVFLASSPRWYTDRCTTLCYTWNNNRLTQAIENTSPSASPRTGSGPVFGAGGIFLGRLPTLGGRSASGGKDYRTAAVGSTSQEVTSPSSGDRQRHKYTSEQILSKFSTDAVRRILCLTYDFKPGCFGQGLTDWGVGSCSVR